MSEAQYFADQAALLDPNCYVYRDGAFWSETVPANKTWYMVNAWALRKPANPNQNYKWHHRPLDTRQALLMPSGYSFKADDYGYAYYADPSIVQANDARYQNDPKGLYYGRLERLKTLPLESLHVHIPQGGANMAYALGSFPTEAERILITHVDCHDGCWVILQNGSLVSITNPMNTQDELDDVRPIRFAPSTYAPILRSRHPHIRLGLGSVSGNGVQTYDGWGSVHFYRLPSDW